MHRRPHPQRRKPEPTIALINVVFLMLVFFLVAGTIAQTSDPKITLVSTSGLATSAPPDALVLHPDGRVTHQGSQSSVGAYLATRPDGLARILPDRAAPAQALLELAAALKTGGAKQVRLVTQEVPE